MTQKCRLNRKIIEQMEDPVRGEKWVADSVVNGFGIRLWRTKSGCEAAYAIRVMDQNGKMVRKTFRPQKSLWRRLTIDAPAFSAYLKTARDWARDEIAKLKGRKTLLEKRYERLHRETCRARARTFEEAALNLIEQGAKSGLAQGYCDNQHKLLNCLSDEFLLLKLGEITPDIVTNYLLKPPIPRTTLRTLKSFVGGVMEKEGFMPHFSSDLSDLFWKEWKSQGDEKLKTYLRDDYRAVFQKLESEETFWQQAWCIRLYFEFNVAFRRIQSAKWTHFIGDRWVPYLPEERKHWSSYVQRIEPEQQVLLDKIKRLGVKQFGEHTYLFPSTHGRSCEHIRTVDPYWNAFAHDMKLHGTSLSAFVGNYRPRKTLGFHWKYQQEDSELAREIKHEELSKVLTRMK